MATPSLAMIPSAYADSKVYSVLPNNGDGDFTFNRDSSATRVGQNGLIQEVGFFGSELVNSWTNADFSSFASNGSNITQMVSSGSGNNCYSLATFTSGKTYELKFTSSQNITAQIRISPNTNLTSAQVVLSNPTSGFNSIIFTATSNYSHIGFFANSSFTDTQITEFISREIQGDQPRLNYDINANGQVQSCPSLLLEPASTNLITYSEDFSNAAWTKEGTSIVSNTIISPNGTLNADKLVEDTSTGLHRTYSTLITTAQNNDYTSSVFAKKGGRNIFGIQKSSGAQTFVWFNLDTGTIELQEADIVGKIESLPNGWYKCSATWDSSSSTSDRVFIQLAKSTSNTSYTGDGTSGIYIWGAQFEQQSYATSYIPTTGASQTRAAETCNDAGTAATFNSTEGVLYFESSALALAGGDSRISLSDGTLNNRISFAYSPTASKGYIIVKINGVSVINNLNVEIGNHLDTKKIAISYKSGDTKVFLNGVELSIASSVSFSGGAVNDLSFESANSSVKFYGKCKDIRVYNEALTDAQLIALTT